MRLLLKRRYSPRGSLGRLFLGTRQLCLIREAPKFCYSPDRYCLKEGVYELTPVHTEAEGWRVRVGKEGWIRSKAPEYLPEAGELCPVTEYRADGTPLFTRLAFQKLLDELGELWQRGEVVELQVMGMGIPYKLTACPIPKFS